MSNKLLLFMACITILVSCQKSSNEQDNSNNQNTGLPSSAETKPQYNNTSFGVYKGVIIGSTGTIVFKINNGDNILKGYLAIDNTKDTLSTTQTVIAGQPIVNVHFVGRISSMNLSANADGTNAIVTNISITGHSNVAVLVIHENSTKQIFCYEGTFSGSRSGTINCARVGEGNGDTAYILTKIQDTAAYFTGYGQVNNNSTSINLGANLALINQGSFSGNNFNGTWTWAYYGTGTFACTRTY